MTKVISRYRGVSWCRDRKVWQASIKHKGKKLFLGRFSCEEDAARAYDYKAIDILGKFAIINFGDKNKKLCRMCNKLKTIELFGGHLRDGVVRKNSYCKECSSARSKSYYEKKKDWIKAKPKKRKSAKDIRRYTLKYKYGLLSNEIDAEIKATSACPICTNPISHNGPKNGRTPVIDHNHETGLFRGIICLQCNAAIGALGDSVEVLRRAISYLERNK